MTYPYNYIKLQFLPCQCSGHGQWAAHRPPDIVSPKDWPPASGGPCVVLWVGFAGGRPFSSLARVTPAVLLYQTWSRLYTKLEQLW